MRFRGMAESITPMCSLLTPGPLIRFPVGPVPGYETRRKEHALPIVCDEFRPAIPRWVARQHCPSSLRRLNQLKPIARPNGIIYYRTVTSLLTVCLIDRDKLNKARHDFARGDDPVEVFQRYQRF
jgi:hypothetical protein